MQKAEKEIPSFSHEDLGMIICTAVCLPLTTWPSYLLPHPNSSDSSSPTRHHNCIMTPKDLRNERNIFSLWGRLTENETFWKTHLIGTRQDLSKRGPQVDPAPDHHNLAILGHNLLLLI